MKIKFGAAAFSAALVAAAAVSSASTLFSEDFNDVGEFNLPVNELGRAGGVWDTTKTWTTSPTVGLDGWTFSTSIDGDGALEWEGWSTAIKDFWVAVAGDQNRSQFTLSTGNAFIADPDEYDDYNGGINNAGYNVFAKTRAISLAGVAANSVSIKFASSWRPEGFDDDDLTNNQTGMVRVSYDGGTTWTTVLHWDSDDFGSFFHPDNTNEAVNIAVNNPSGATSMIVEFSLTKANNDWWWAIDNLVVEGSVTGTGPFGPSSFSISEGIYFGGDITSLQASDDNSLFVLNDENAPNGKAEFVLNGANASSTNIGVKYETGATREDLSLFVESWSYTANAWVVRQTSTTTLADTVRTFSLTGAGHVSPSCEAKLQFRWIPQADLEAADGWSESVDQVEWTIN